MTTNVSNNPSQTTKCHVCGCCSQGPHTHTQSKKQSAWERQKDFRSLRSVQSCGRWSFSWTVCKAGGSDHVRNILFIYLFIDLFLFIYFCLFIFVHLFA